MVEGVRAAFKVPFNPLPSHEGRRKKEKRKEKDDSFNPLPSHEGRQMMQHEMQHEKSFNPLPSHEGRPLSFTLINPLCLLSIHFPLTREDFKRGVYVQRLYLSIHFPLTREDAVRHPLSAHSYHLSIHFPLTREDKGMSIDYHVELIFQSTSLSRGKTSLGDPIALSRTLSIHFPLTREDRAQMRIPTSRSPFNPLPSHEGRHTGNQENIGYESFQSTSLSRGKTLESEAEE